MRSWAMSMMSSLPGLSDPGQCMLLLARIDWACIPGGRFLHYHTSVHAQAEMRSFSRMAWHTWQHEGNT
jgi:hypothetical protein